MAVPPFRTIFKLSTMASGNLERLAKVLLQMLHPLR
jgi:hypothetical protein